ncbi:uncharacterized protein [Atheta coriaria]|uniref:uncharacterized protein n=1 Tax=Dalotia coriaria TaxID=877792 RepID=UPI0031F39859
MNNTIKIPVYIRRYDLFEEPEEELLEFELDPNMPYAELRSEIQSYFNISPEDPKVIKVRNKDYVLVPLTDMLTQSRDHSPYTIDVNKITRANESKVSMLHDAYIDAVKQKLQCMESRISQAEVLLPQLQWSRQTHLDQTVSKLSTRVSFLNRRVDELMPPEWKSKMPETIS